MLCIIQLQSVMGLSKNDVQWTFIRCQVASRAEGGEGRHSEKGISLVSNLSKGFPDIPDVR